MYYIYTESELRKQFKDREYSEKEKFEFFGTENEDDAFYSGIEEEGFHPATQGGANTLYVREE